MKQVLLFSAALLICLFSASGLSAQSCQPNPACKAICGSSKAGVQSDVNHSNTAAGLVPVVAVNQQEAVAGHAAKKAECNPAKCDVSKCDPSQCDPSKCDLTKCNPANCDPGKCIPNGAGGAKAKSTRI